MNTHKDSLQKILSKKNIDADNKYFYVCGPLRMMDAIVKQLTNLQVDKKLIIKEAF